MIFRDDYDKDLICEPHDHAWTLNVEEGRAFLRCLDPCVVPENDEEREEVMFSHHERICMHPPEDTDLFMNGDIRVDLTYKVDNEDLQKSEDQPVDGWFEITPRREH